MADLPNTMAMDDSASDNNDNANTHNTNHNSTAVCGYLVRIDQSGNHCTPFILTKRNTTIGRKKNNDITLTDATISSNHAEIEIDSANKQAFIIDLGSTNKTRVGRLLPSATQSNKSCKAHRECILNSGDYATFGDVHFIFYHEEDYDEYQSQQSQQKVSPNTAQRNSISLSHTQAFDVDETAANTAANRTSKSEIDLKMSVSDDDTVKQPSPKRVQFKDPHSPNDNSHNLEPTLAWDDDSTQEEEDNAASDPLAATMAFDDIDDEDDGLAATMAFDDIDDNNGLAATMAFDDDVDDGKDALPATMAFGDDNDNDEYGMCGGDLAATIAIGSDNEEDHGGELAATMAIGSDDEDDGVGELAATMRIDDDVDGELAATMAIGSDNEDGNMGDVDGELAATMAIDGSDDDEAVDNLPQTVAIDDNDGDTEEEVGEEEVDKLPQTIAMDVYEDECAATMAIIDDNDDVNDQLPATIAIDNDGDTEEEEEEDVGHQLPATMAMNDEDVAPDTDLAATLAVLSGNSNDSNDDNNNALAATMAIDESECHEFQSEKVQLEPTLAVMDDNKNETELAATVRIDTEDIDLNDSNDSNELNTNLDELSSEEEEEEPQEPFIEEKPKEPTPPPPPPPPQKRGRGRRAKQTKKKEQPEEVEPINARRRSARIAKRSNSVSTENSAEDGEGDIEMKANRKNEKKVATQKKTAAKANGSLSSLFALRGKKNALRGKKRTVQQRDEEEDNTNNSNTNPVEPPPAKRPRRGRIAKRSQQSDDENDTNNKNKKKKSPNRRKKSNNRRRKRKQSSSEEEEEDKHVVLLRTGTDNKNETKQLQNLGATVLEDYDDSVTHIISSQPRRTLKFIAGIATAKHIVSDLWPKHCVKKRTLNVDESRYFPHNKATRNFEKEYGFKLKESFKCLRERKEPLFDGYKVYFSSEHTRNVKKAIGTMAQSHGAALMSRIPRATSSGEIDEMIIVIGQDINHKHCKSLERKGYTVYNRDIIITSILRQQIDFDDEEFILQ